MASEYYAGTPFSTVASTALKDDVLNQPDVTLAAGADGSKRDTAGHGSHAALN